MFREAAEAAGVVRAQLERNREPARRLGAKLRDLAPRAVVTCARGSSDHAATFAKYLLETRVGVLTASAAPSVSSIYGAGPDLAQCLFVAISQSGQSPDLLANAQAAKQAGAYTVALVNDANSPLARASDHCLPLCAGEEKSVAATKSYIASLAAIAHLVAAWTDDARLFEALDALPGQLERAWDLDWEAAAAKLVSANHLFVIARGVGLGVAQEAALKFKETCGLHAESFSSAEVRHGPQALMRDAFPALFLAQDDETRPGLEALAGEWVARGLDVIVAGCDVRGATVLPTLAADAALQPILLAQTFYRLANAVAIARGHDPDSPPNLRKITETT
jgi:glucosamine--fructose-6-phosphate aminotransferase (isomerizing)